MSLWSPVEADSGEGGVLAAHAPGTVIVLNGTGSSGKSSIARALQSVAPRPLLRLGIDAFLGRLPSHYVGLSQQAHEGLKFRLDSHGRVEAMEPGPVFHQLVRGMHRAVAALAASGMSVVMDHVLWEDAWLHDCASVLPAALFVGVRCSREVVQERARKRGDRAPGYEMFAYESVHQGRSYDVEVDTTDSDMTRCVTEIVRRSRAGPPQALAALCAQCRPDMFSEIGSFSWTWDDIHALRPSAEAPSQ